MKTQAIINKLLQSVGVLALALLFVGLGKWQLDSAIDLNRAKAAAKVVDQAIYPIAELTRPAIALDSRSVDKRTSITGFYIANFKAPRQEDSSGEVSDWEVGLLQIQDSTPSAGILIVRGLWVDRLRHPEITISSQVKVTGTLQPRQNDDRADNVPGVISRLDSSVIVGLTDLELYDGFLMATSEIVSASELVRDRPVAAKPITKASGYYWQHISYVAIWWLMAAIVLYLPFYRRTIAA